MVKSPVFDQKSSKNKKLKNMQQLMNLVSSDLSNRYPNKDEIVLMSHTPAAIHKSQNLGALADTRKHHQANKYGLVFVKGPQDVNKGPSERPRRSKNRRKTDKIQKKQVQKVGGFGGHKKSMEDPQHSLRHSLRQSKPQNHEELNKNLFYSQKVSEVKSSLWTPTSPSQQIKTIQQIIKSYSLTPHNSSSPQKRKYLDQDYETIKLASPRPHPQVAHKSNSKGSQPHPQTLAKAARKAINSRNAQKVQKAQKSAKKTKNERIATEVANMLSKSNHNAPFSRSVNPNRKSGASSSQNTRAGAHRLKRLFKRADFSLMNDLSNKETKQFLVIKKPVLGKKGSQKGLQMYKEAHNMQRMAGNEAEMESPRFAQIQSQGSSRRRLSRVKSLERSDQASGMEMELRKTSGGFDLALKRNSSLELKSGSEVNLSLEKAKRVAAKELSKQLAQNKKNGKKKRVSKRRKKKRKKVGLRESGGEPSGRSARFEATEVEKESKSAKNGKNLRRNLSNLNRPKNGFGGSGGKQGGVGKHGGAKRGTRKLSSRRNREERSYMGSGNGGGGGTSESRKKAPGQPNRARNVVYGDRISSYHVKKGRFGVEMGRKKSAKKRKKPDDLSSVLNTRVYSGQQKLHNTSKSTANSINPTMRNTQNFTDFSNFPSTRTSISNIGESPSTRATTKRRVKLNKSAFEVNQRDPKNGQIFASALPGLPQKGGTTLLSTIRERSRRPQTRGAGRSRRNPQIQNPDSEPKNSLRGYTEQHRLANLANLMYIEPGYSAKEGGGLPKIKFSMGRGNNHKLVLRHLMNRSDCESNNFWNSSNLVWTQTRSKRANESVFADLVDFDLGLDFLVRRVCGGLADGLGVCGDAEEGSRSVGVAQEGVFGDEKSEKIEGFGGPDAVEKAIKEAEATPDVSGRDRIGQKSPKRPQKAKNPKSLKTATKSLKKRFLALKLYKTPFPSLIDELFTQLTSKKNSENSKISRIKSSNLRLTNHIKGMKNITRKQLLTQNVYKFASNTLKKDPFSIIPKTYFIKEETTETDVEAMLEDIEATESFENPWIIKPGEFSNRGCGIKMGFGKDEIRRLTLELSEKRKGAVILVQKYLATPLLYKERKFDLRCYALVVKTRRRFSVFWYGDGYARTTSFKYSKDVKDNLMVHLTNEAVQVKCKF